jgi:hypothetical protein
VVRATERLLGVIFAGEEVEERREKANSRSVVLTSKERNAYPDPAPPQSRLVFVLARGAIRPEEEEENARRQPDALYWVVGRIKVLMYA